MAQNIYDDETFFDRYATLDRSVHGLELAPEWPTLRAMVGDVDGARVVDLGCGYGWFVRWALANGVASVLGIDVSARMLERARADTPDATGPGTHDGTVEWLHADLEEVHLAPRSFDLAYSSLALHYLHDLDHVVAQVAGALVDGGRLVCSVEHPVFTAPGHPAFVEGPDGTDVWPLDGYQHEGRRVTDWLVEGVVKQHRTISTYVATLHRHGLQVHELVEWSPSDEDVARHPEWAPDRGRPNFLLLAAERVER